ncbi:nuclear transport factor 2 family protein [Roseobacter sinensis]|uniref:Nuclear transport factor 2 family protein n=1 Tax=Roseobacter sinensis TaxID=2931391 RepID=A0ABT3BEX3_9RHOB|nr:nuclear transport factor 2 family protein [Roseobacter sp. WL0113]MCV3272115.1 nuclear transport factor 2 family protein [Roseobacter sp. WL0113]
MPNTDPLPALTTLLRESLGDLLDPADSFLEMCAEDVAFEAPYAPAGSNVLKGRAAVANYLPVVREHYDIRELAETALYRTTDPEVVILEFEARNSTGRKTGLPYDQRYINVIWVRNGKIVDYRDYWNPVVALAAVGGTDGMPDVVKGSAA